MSEAPVSAREKIVALAAQFDEARALAKNLEFDAPSAAAVERAAALLALIAEAVTETSVFEVALGEDGTIEITAASDASFVTIDISPASARAAMVVQDAHSDEITVSIPIATDQDILSQIDRAAA